jgi:hypothetical protein
VATRLISLTDLSSQQLDAWRRLVLRAAEPNPFFEPYYLLATIQRVDASGAHLLVVERDGEWLACVPVRRRGAPPLGALQSWCDEYCFLGTPLVDRDHVPDAVEDLVSATIRRHRVLVLERLALDGPIGATVEELVESRRYQLVPRPSGGPTTSRRRRRARRPASCAGCAAGSRGSSAGRPRSATAPTTRRRSRTSCSSRSRAGRAAPRPRSGRGRPT